MDAGSRVHDITHFAHPQTKGAVLERFLHHATRKEPKVAAILRAIRQPRRHTPHLLQSLSFSASLLNASTDPPSITICWRIAFSAEIASSFEQVIDGLRHDAGCLEFLLLNPTLIPITCVSSGCAKHEPAWATRYSFRPLIVLLPLAHSTWFLRLSCDSTKSLTATC